ncbi:hypothetical protein [Salibacter halophilus]|uniref:DoxX family membrane protein n=1 Tax=Salibacter halophilus TaxID=1803916 RepID=A0A6N6M8M9_9FLAO|nr:hypothetical protein [Salibacter halophilus]KAB1065114.1 hypothetical protein F3059_03955 [Salibacter halophilus]
MTYSNKNIISLFFRLVLGFVYLTAGFSKLAPDYIGNVIGPSRVPDELFSACVLYLFYAIAFLQVVAGILVLSLRYAGAGLLLLLPLTLVIFIFTLLAGFGATPLINVVLLGITTFEIYREYYAFSNQERVNPFLYYLSGKIKNQYSKKLTQIIIGLSVLSLFTVLFPSIHLNILLSLALGLLTFMLLRLSHLATIDKVLVVLFTLFGLSVLNGIWLKEIDPRFFYKALVLIPIGTIIGLLRMVWYRYKLKKQAG